MNDINTALMLMIVGMGTVFIILLFVIYFSKAMIIMVNKIAPEDTSSGQGSGNSSSDSISPRVTNIITSAVSKVAPGAKINNIKKL